MEEQSSCTVGSWPLSQQNKAGEGGGGVGNVDQS